MVDDGGNHNDDEDDMVDDNFVDGDDAAGPQLHAFMCLTWSS